MTLDDISRWETELTPLVPLESATPFARETARRFNAETVEVRDAIVVPVRALLEKGAANPDLLSCFERKMAEIAFWRRVLLRALPGAFAPAPGCPACLVGYLVS